MAEQKIVWKNENDLIGKTLNEVEYRNGKSKDKITGKENSNPDSFDFETLVDEKVGNKRILVKRSAVIWGDKETQRDEYVKIMLMTLDRDGIPRGDKKQIQISSGLVIHLREALERFNETIGNPVKKE